MKKDASPALKPRRKVEKYSLKYLPAGKQALFRKEAAFALLAAGEGSRLGYGGPKGMFPITLRTKKSIFELFARKLLRLQKKYATKVFWLIMLSLKNREKTLAFFARHEFFGLAKEQVWFFTQEDLPYLDEKGNVIRDERQKIVTGPGGNGAFFESLKNTPFLQKLKKFNIKYLQIAPVDNPLLEPLDPVFLGFHIKHRNEVSLIALKNQNSLGKVGVLAEKNQKLKIAEYLQVGKNAGFPYANSAVFLFDLDFIIKHRFNLPVYKVLKEVETASAGRKISAYKQEKFIFDALDYTEKASCILYPREKCFAPLKSRKSLPAIEKLFLQSRDAIYF